MKKYLFRIPKPTKEEQNKELDNFKLELANYSNNIKYIENKFGDIDVEIKLHNEINLEKFVKFITSKPYLGHL